MPCSGGQAGRAPHVRCFIRCPQCGQRFPGGFQHVGHRAHCKLCDARFVVQRRRETASRDKARVAAACPHCKAPRKVPRTQLDNPVFCDQCGREYVAKRTADAPDKGGGLDLLARLEQGSREAADWLDPRRMDVRALRRLAQTLRGEAPSGLVAALDAAGARGAMAFSPDGRLLAAALGARRARRLGAPEPGESPPGGLFLWDVPTARQAAAGPSAAEPPAHGESVAFSPDSQYLAGTDGDRIPIWNLDAGAKAETLALEDFHLASQVAFSPEGRLIAAGCDVGGVLTIWDGCLVLDIPTGQERVWSVAFHPDSRRIASAGENETVRIWDAATGQLLREFAGHLGPVYCVAFSPFGWLMATASADGAVKLWNPNTGELTRTLPGHVKGAWCVAFRPHGDQLASSGADGWTRLWDTQTGRLINQTPLGPSAGLAFSPTGRHLAVQHERWVFIIRLASAGSR